LQKLLEGNHDDREQVISVQSPEMQPKFRKFIKSKRDSEILIELLLSDLSHSGKQVKENPSNQFLSDEEKQRCAEAAAWLNIELNRLFDACKSKVS